MLVALCGWSAPAEGDESPRETGSRTAKNGFRNEDEIRDRLNNWKSDPDAKEWLAAMGLDVGRMESVRASKPHGEKSDVEVRVTVDGRERVEGISIKLVSTSHGFNQIDKRWLAKYAELWDMPPEVEAGLQLFVGEIPPTRPGRDSRRMFLDELDDVPRESIMNFFRQHKSRIVSDLIAGDGQHDAEWMMVTIKSGTGQQWAIRSTKDAAKYFAEGEVEVTKAGNLRIGRITMQRKGGDGGRDTAKMLQFKINPAELLKSPVPGASVR